MPVDYKFRRGIDLPSWHWLNQFPQGVSNPGVGHGYDGVRYMYWAIQYGSSTAASTTQLWRFDTWTNGWQYLAALTASFTGLDIDYDAVRNVVWIAEGNATTAWRYFNLNAAPITILGVTTPAMTLSAAIATILPVAAGAGANFDQQSDGDVPSAIIIRATANQDPAVSSRQIASAAVGSNATTLIDLTAEFHGGLVGCYARFTSGALAGTSRVITAVPNSTTLTVTAFGAGPAAGDTFIVEMPGGHASNAFVGANALAATGGSATTLVATGSGWPVNIYRDSDVLIVGGTGAGQRRRIASNTIDTITLAGATAGNPRTGPWTTAPDATSMFRIMPSEDFLLYISNTAAIYRCDLAATAVAWTAMTAPPAAFGGGAYMARSGGFAPFSVVAFRGAATATVYRYDMGLATWATLPSLWGAETLTTGGAVARITGRMRFAIHIQGSGRLYTYNPITGTLEPITMAPYAVPVANEGKRLRFVRSTDGADMLYFLRAGGQEFFRLPMEWL